MGLFYGARATGYVGSAITTVSTTQDLVTAHASSLTDYSSEITELRFSDGEADVSELNLFGTQAVDESRPALKTAEFTMVLDDTKGIAPLEFFGTSSQSETNPTGSWNRWAYTDPTGDRVKKAILFKVTDGTNTVHVLMNNAYFTTTGEITQAADGHTEIGMTAKCLISDVYLEDNI